MSPFTGPLDAATTAELQDLLLRDAKGGPTFPEARAKPKPKPYAKAKSYKAKPSWPPFAGRSRGGAGA